MNDNSGQQNSNFSQQDPLQAATSAPQVQPVSSAAPAQQVQPANNMQGNFSYGGPEVAPAPAPVENSPQAVEYGYEAIKRIEQTPASLEQIERKENTNPPPTQAPPANAQAAPSQVAPPKVAPESNSPKFFGYNVSPQLTSNPKMVMASKGKGDPKMAKTWIMVLLDRILKQNSLK